MTPEHNLDHDHHTPGDGLERQLAGRLRARADRTRLDLDLDRITGRSTTPRATRQRNRAPGRLVPALAFGVVALVVGGLLALAVTRDPADEVPGVTTVPSIPSIVAEPVPATDPSPPTYGVLSESEGPTITDHWHVAYGFSLCDQWVQLTGNLEEVDAQGRFVNDDYLRTGIHSHDDGVIHIHPFTSQAVGDEATLGLFLANYGVELTDDGGFIAPPDQLADVRCGTAGKQLVVVVWPDATDPTEKLIVTEGLAGIPLRDGAAITIALTDASDDVLPPPWAAALPELGAIDGGQIPPDDLLTTVAPEPPVTTAPPSMPPTGPIVDFAQCGQPVAGPASDLGVVTEWIVVDPGGAAVELTLRNTTSDPILIGFAPFLATLDGDGTVASRPAELGVWGYQVMPPGEPFVYRAVSAVGVAACAADGVVSDEALTTGAHEFVGVLDLGGVIVATDPVVLDVDSDGVVSGGDSRSD